MKAESMGVPQGAFDRAKPVADSQCQGYDKGNGAVNGSKKRPKKPFK